MSIDSTGYRTKMDVDELEDEVMTLRAQLQVMTLDRNTWHTIADERSAEIARLDGEVSGWHKLASERLNAIAKLVAGGGSVCSHI